MELHHSLLRANVYIQYIQICNPIVKNYNLNLKRMLCFLIRKLKEQIFILFEVKLKFLNLQFFRL